MSYSSSNKSSYDDFNLSENNLDASIGSSSSSKAVLAALRALQDKIRRLEAERSTALDESNQLRHQLKQQEIEFEHVKQRDQLQSQKNISEVRHAYDKLLSDKAELEIRLSKLEDKSKVLMSNSEDMQVKVRLLEEEKHGSSMKIRELENQRNSIESQIKLAQIKEEEMTQSLQWENKRHEESLNFTHRRVQSLQEELQDLCKEKGTSDAKLLELDGLVTQLLSINQSLVKQLSNDSGINAIKKLTTSTTTKKKIIKKPKAPKVASMDTLSSQLNKHPNNEKMVLMNHANHLKEIESLKNMHKMYSNIARNIKSSSKKDTFSTSTSDGVTQHASSGSSSYSAPVMGKKNNTRVSRKKAQMRSDQQQQQQQQQQSSYSSSASVPAMSKIRPSSVYSGSSNTNSHHYSNNNNNYINSSSNSSSMDVRLPKPSVSFDYDHENSRGLDMSSDRDEEYSSSGSSSHPNYPQYRSDNNNNNNSSNNNNNMPRSILSTSKNSSSGHTRSSFAHDQAEVKDVISSLEEEFDALNAQYRNLLSNVQAHPTSTNTSSSYSSGSSIVRDAPSHVSPDTIQAQAEEIVTVIQKLHKKGEQIRSLKNASP